MTSRSSPYAGDEEEAVSDIASASTPVTSISSELDRPSNMLRASRFGSGATELETEDWDRERPIPSSSARSNCEPMSADGTLPRQQRVQHHEAQTLGLYPL